MIFLTSPYEKWIPSFRGTRYRQFASFPRLLKIWQGSITFKPWLNPNYNYHRMYFTILIRILNSHMKYSVRLDRCSFILFKVFLPFFRVRFSSLLPFTFTTHDRRTTRFSLYIFSVSFLFNSISSILCFIWYTDY